MIGLEPGKHVREHACQQGIGGGYAHGPQRLQIHALQTALDVEHLVFDAPRRGGKIFARRRGGIAITSAHEQGRAHALLDRMEAPEHGGVIDPELPCGTAQGAGCGNGEDRPQIIPGKHACTHANAVFGNGECLCAYQESRLTGVDEKAFQEMVMHVLLVYAHPEPVSFNGALRDISAAVLEGLGRTVEVADLYREQFDPVEGPVHYTARANPDYFETLTEQRAAATEGRQPADVKREIARLERSDLVIFHYPLWWHRPPVILKGWQDRVFAYGPVYSGSVRWDRGHFAGRRAMCVVTTGGPAATFTPTGRSGDIRVLMWPMHCSLYYVGYEVLPPFVAHGIRGGGLAYKDQAAFREHLEAQKAAWEGGLATPERDTPIPSAGWDE